MKKILFLIVNFEIGGAQNALVRHINLLNPNKYKIAVISLSGKGSLKNKITNKNVEVYEANFSKKVTSVLKIYKLYKYVKAFSPDIIHSWMYHADLVGGVLGKLLHTRLIIWGVRSADFINENTSFSLKMVFRICSVLSRVVPDLIIYNSHKGANFHKSFGYRCTQYTVVPNWIDCEEFKPSIENRKIFLDRLNISSDKKIIGLVARLDHLKNHTGFLEFAQVICQYRNDCQFVMIGDGIEGNIEIDRLVVERGLTDQVTILPSTKSISSVISAFDATIITSISEAFPNVMIESLACGVPCFSTNVGDAKQINFIEDWVIKRCDMKELAKVFQDYFELDFAERSKISNNMVKYCKDNFGGKVYADTYSQIYS